MNKVICVYASSSNLIDRKYFDIASQLGEAIARNGDTLLFGGGVRGLMGAAATAVHRHNGRVVGIIPEALNQKGVVYETCDELIVTKSLRERKAIMDERSDAFIALPGGFGTLEELLEIITLKQLKYHNKPIVILNFDGFSMHCWNSSGTSWISISPNLNQACSTMSQQIQKMHWSISRHTSRSK